MKRLFLLSAAALVMCAASVSTANAAEPTDSVTVNNSGQSENTDSVTVNNGTKPDEETHEINSFTLEDFELEYLLTNADTIETAVMEQFDVLYEAWTEVFERSIHSNFDLIADCDEYRQLLNYCRQNRRLEFALFLKIAEDDIVAVKPLEDLTLEDNRQALAMAKDFCAEHGIISPLQVAKAYVKAIISIRLYGLTNVTPEQVFLPHRGATAIDSPTIGNRPSGIYDLNGRRLTAEPAHGLYIKDGKKVWK